MHFVAMLRARAAPPPHSRADAPRRFPVSGTAERGLLGGSGSGADGSILILHISRKHNRQWLFLGVPGANSFHEKMAPRMKKDNIESER